MIIGDICQVKRWPACNWPGVLGQRKFMEVTYATSMSPCVYMISGHEDRMGFRNRRGWTSGGSPVFDQHIYHLTYCKRRLTDLSKETDSFNVLEITFLHTIKKPYQAQMLAAKPDCLSLSPGVHMVRGENQLGGLSSGLHTCALVHVCHSLGCKS